VIVLGNSAVLITLYLSKRKSRMNFFIKQLAIAGNTHKLLTSSLLLLFFHNIFFFFFQQHRFECGFAQRTRRYHMEIYSYMGGGQSGMQIHKIHASSSHLCFNLRACGVKYRPIRCYYTSYELFQLLYVLTLSYISITLFRLIFHPPSCTCFMLQALANVH
jgi:hypothetical protein